jgi:hypothetical protein
MAKKKNDHIVLKVFGVIVGLVGAIFALRKIITGPLKSLFKKNK